MSWVPHPQLNWEGHGHTGRGDAPTFSGRLAPGAPDFGMAPGSEALGRRRIYELRCYTSGVLVVELFRWLKHVTSLQATTEH